jgi:hypothetical protein
VEVVCRYWLAFADALGAFLDEAAFRVALAWSVIVGKAPIETEKRHWDRAREVPILIDVLDWTSDRRIFSVLVWPALEDQPSTNAHLQRVDAVKRVIAAGSSEMAWSMHFHTDYALRWDHKREVWTGGADDGLNLDGSAKL